MQRLLPHQPEIPKAIVKANSHQKFSHIQTHSAAPESGSNDP
jgi:hypothetical protein